MAPSSQAGPSRSTTITPPVSRPDTPSASNRKYKKRKKQPRQTSPVGSKLQHSDADIDEPPKPHSSSPQVFQEEEFIAFDFGNAPEFAEGPDKRSEVLDHHDRRKSSPVPPWRKDENGEADHAGRKRKVAEIDLNDGYANKKQRVDAASRRAPWAWDVEWDRCQNVSQMLHEEVDAFVKYISPTPVEDEVRSMIVQTVRNAVVAAFPDAEVLPFGSYETKLYLPLGDIDLVILSESMAYSRSQSVLHALANTMKRAGITDRVTIIAKAKVPIIKFVTRHGRFSVDVSVNQNNGVAAGKIIKNFIRELPALRALVLIIKSFLNQRSMNEVFTGGLGSYSIVCLVVSFLQMHPKIRRGEIDPEKNLGTLVMEFFELYGLYFNYQEVGISLRDGGSYYNKSRRGWSDFRNPGLLSIEDPGDSSNDISKGSYHIAKVRTTFAGAHGIMTSAAYLHAGYIDSRRRHRHVQLYQPHDPEEMSILSSVMGVTQETINHRRLTQEVYDSGVLHRMLGIKLHSSASVSVIHDEVQAATQQSSSQARAHAASSVQHAWGEADMELASDQGETDRETDEESRYRMADSKTNQPPKKRQRVGKEKDVHTIYTTDEEDESAIGEGDLRLHIGGDQADGITDEEAQYEVISDSEDGGERRAKRDEKRSYWLSKGVGVIDDDYSSDGP